MKQVNRSSVPGLSIRAHRPNREESTSLAKPIRFLHTTKDRVLQSSVLVLTFYSISRFSVVVNSGETELRNRD